LSQIEEKTSFSFLELFFNRWYLDDEDAEKENISARFSMDYIDQFLPQDKGNWQMASKLRLFSNSQRNLITYEIVSRVKVANCKRVQKDIQILLQDGVFSTVFALHDGSAYESGQKINDRAILYQMWKGGLKCQPIHKLRAYFGERIAFHFAWLGHYSFWLFVAGIVGLFVFIFGVFHSFFDTNWKFRYDEVTSSDYARIFDNHLTLPYAWFISCWGVLYVQFWARRQSVLSSQWSTATLIHKETQRPLWNTKHTRPNQVTGKLEPFEPFETRLTLYFISGLFTGIMVNI
jgi:anoctamin-1